MTREWWMDGQLRVAIIGAGIFGLTAALELRRRGHEVLLLDGGPVPHPEAASTDISKVVRIEYGADATYARLAEQSRTAWLDWNRHLFAVDLYHECGAAFLTTREMEPGGYEFENFRSLLERGHAPRRIRPDDLRVLMPGWNADLYVDGYFNPAAGWVHSGRVVVALAEEAARLGVSVRTGVQAREIDDDGSVVMANGSRVRADAVVVAAGAWTPVLLPELSERLRPVGQPVFHLQPTDPARFAPPRFFVFGADSARTGWYGFPAHPESGVVKIANHGPGWPVHPERDVRAVPDDWVSRLRAFLTDTIPELADAPLVGVRCCLYCDTADEHFWIDRHPDRPRIVVAAGDSGHAFKFAPLLGGWIADAVEGRANPDTRRFRWREEPAGSGQEASRFRGEAS
jgi:sarcosine oxidase / L-pipecolate oxidase